MRRLPQHADTSGRVFIGTCMMVRSRIIAHKAPKRLRGEVVTVVMGMIASPEGIRARGSQPTGNALTRNLRAPFIGMPLLAERAVLVLVEAGDVEEI